MNQTKNEKKKKQKTYEQLSPEMVIKIREVRLRKGEGNHGGKDLSKR